MELFEWYLPCGGFDSILEVGADDSAAEEYEPCLLMMQEVFPLDARMHNMDQPADPSFSRSCCLPSCC